MQAEFSVEMGSEAPALEVPWASASSPQHYFDLRAQPELLLNIDEAHDNRPLGEFLSAINGKWSRLETAKCDAWSSNEMEPGEEMFGAALKFESYIDLIFTDPELRALQERHEQFALALCQLLGRAPEIAAAAEFVLRRCFFRPPAAARDLDGFCLTFYCTGYGDDEDDARRHWMIGLKLVENAILQLSSSWKPEAVET